MSKKERLTEILSNLMSGGEIEGSAIITRDGLLVASELHGEINQDAFAAMSATMTGAAETAIQELKKASADRIIVESKNAKLITICAGEQAILTCIVSPDANLGLILVEMEEAAKKIINETNLK